MKKFFISLFAMMIATVSFAQNTLVATLNHGDEISIFYGATAFQKAMESATNGDVISLSGGGFLSTDITKAISIRGAGIDNANPTYLINKFRINIQEETSSRLTIEGIRIPNTIETLGTLINTYFVKDDIATIYTFGGINNAVFSNCKLYDICVNSNEKTTMQFINCYVKFNNSGYDETSAASFINCVIIHNFGWPTIVSSTLLNSIVYWSNVYRSFNSSNTITNCVGIADNIENAGEIFREIIAGSNNKTATLSIFKESDLSLDLTDEAKSTYIGTDGTPVGMYGGILPYNTTPSYPQVAKMNVANKTTADGKLSVDIEVSSAE